MLHLLTYFDHWNGHPVGIGLMVPRRPLQQLKELSIRKEGKDKSPYEHSVTNPFRPPMSQELLKLKIKRFSLLQKEDLLLSPKNSFKEIFFDFLGAKVVRQGYVHGCIVS